MGAINTRGGKLYLDFRYKGNRCREQTQLTDTPANRKRAQQIIDHIEAAITLGSFDYASYFPNSRKLEQIQHHDKTEAQVNSNFPLLKESAEDWFKTSEISWRKSYRETVRGRLDKHVLPAFGNKPVNRITKQMILEFRMNLANAVRPGGKKFSADHINHIMTALRMILAHAAERHGFNSPFINIKAMRIQKTYIEPFSLEEVKKIIACVRPDYRNYYIVRFFTGMRSGEIDGLQWKFVDFERRQILIRETWVRNEITYTKTDGSQREINMSEPVYEALKAQHEVTGMHPFVFCTAGGTPLSQNNITNRVWKPLLRLLGFKVRRHYQTRHTAATIWLASGENPEYVARQLGHSNTMMLFKVYSRFVPNLTRQDGSAFNRLLSQTIFKPTSEQGATHEVP